MIVVKNGKVFETIYHARTKEEMKKAKDKSICMNCEYSMHSDCPKIRDFYHIGFQYYPYITDGYQIINDDNSDEKQRLSESDRVMRFCVKGCKFYKDERRVSEPEPQRTRTPKQRHYNSNK